MFEAHDARVGAIGGALFEHLGVGIQRVAMENRRGKTDAGHAQLRERVLGGVLRREPDAYGTGDEAEYQALSEVGAAHAMLVVVAIGGVEDQLREHLVLDFPNSGASRMTHLRADLEILEVVFRASEF
jgi:hypothetical protein